MKFSLSWLKEHLDFDASLGDLSAQLVNLGLEVESISNPAESIGSIVVAHIIEAKQHPNADRLRVCSVDTGSGIVEVVCGAANARTGLKTAYAAIGTYIPGSDITLKKSKIRDIESNGMLCSAGELKLPDKIDGIIELPQDAKVGQKLTDVLGLNDAILDISITPNRADCLSVYGIARDLAAAGFGKLKPINVPKISSAPMPSLNVKIDDLIAAPIFKGRMIRGVKNGDSPDWLKQKLEAAGSKSISKLVDVTNYILFTFGRPLHAFDAGKIQGNMVVRLAKDGEKFTDLKNIEHILSDGMIVICDDSDIISLAGIMGGATTGCDENTSDIFLESAFFEREKIARAGQKLALLSDARYRFERGVDPEFTDAGLDLATQLILDLCGGQASDVIVGSNELKLVENLDNGARKIIAYNPDHLTQLAGLKVDPTEQENFLKHLGFVVNKNDKIWQVTVPSYRFDMAIPQDLIEEILRLKGYDAIPAISLPQDSIMPKPALTTHFHKAMLARRVLAARGYDESVNFAFASENLTNLFAPQSPDLYLSNPISQELSVMRTSLFPHLLQAALENENRGLGNVQFFEISPVFGKQFKDRQENRIAALITNQKPRHFEGSDDHPLMQLKADLWEVLSALGVNTAGLQYSHDVPSYYHPAQSVALGFGPNKVAYIGTLHPKIAKKMKLKSTSYIFEIFLDSLVQPKKKGTAKSYLNLNPLQPVNRDFAFVMDEETPADKLVKAVLSADKVLIKNVHVFDIYRGTPIDAGKKSLALDVTIEPLGATFTDADLEGLSQKIIQAALKTGAVLRV